MKSRNHTVIIVILSVLLAAVVVALAVTLSQIDAARNQGSSSILDNVLSSHSVVASAAEYKGEAITLEDAAGKEVLPFDARNIFPGDTVRKTFRLLIGDPKATVASFSAIYYDRTQDETEEQANRDRSLMRLTVKEGKNLIYDGPFDSVDPIFFTVNGTEPVPFDIAVSLDTSAGNGYASLGLAMDFIFAIEEEGVFTVTYADGVRRDEVFPDVVYTGIEKGTVTPGYVGTPTRDGYQFAGWKPAVSETVETSIIYTATWKKIGSETFLLSDKHQSEKYTTDISHPIGGDVWEETYYVRAEDDGFLSLYMSFDGTIASKALRCALWVEIYCEETDTMIYEGPLSEVSKRFRQEMDGVAGEVYHIDLRISLDESYGNEFSRAFGKLTFKLWGNKSVSLCRCPLCYVLRFFGGPDCFCPWDWIILAILIILIAFIIL